MVIIFSRKANWYKVSYFDLNLHDNRVFTQHVNRIIKHADVKKLTQHVNRDSAQHVNRELIL